MKNIKVISIFIIYSIFSSLSNISCSIFTSKKVIDTVQIVEMKISFDRKQIIYENDRTRISIGYDQYLKYHNTNADSNNYYYILSSKSKQEEINWVKNYFAANDTLFIEDNYLLKNDTLMFRYQQTFVRIIPDMLEIGEASVFNKNKNIIEKKIKARRYLWYCGPVCAGQDRYFYFLSNDPYYPFGAMFYKINDWLS